MKKIFNLFLVVLISITFVSCGKNTSSDIPPEQETINYTNYKLLENGTTNYRLVIEKSATNYEQAAADEIRLFMEKSGGATFNTVTDEEITYSEEAKLIILGDTIFTPNSGVDISAIPKQGFTLKTVGSNLFILGNDLGVLYGAYEFLHKTINFEMYASDCVHYDEKVKELYLQEFNFSDSPDILWRGANYGVLNDSILTHYRMRLCDFRDCFMTMNGDTHHNVFYEYFPKGSYLETHPKWYSDNGGNPCFTAHGDATELELMRKTVLDKMKLIINTQYSMGNEQPAINFSTMDTNTSCSCSACLEAMEKYNGCNSALEILFLKPIARDLKAWMEAEHPGKDVTITFFAYQNYTDAPVIKINNEYVPIDEEVVLEDNMAVYYAYIYGGYNYGVNHIKMTPFRDMMQKWAVLSKSFYIWTYDTNFCEYFSWYNTLDVVQSLYQYLDKYGTKFLFNQGNYLGGVKETGFNYLAAYLESKLMWDVNADVQKLTDNFFKYYFQDAEDAMRDYYNSYMSWTEYLRHTGKLNDAIYQYVTKDQYPKQVLIYWNNCIENAYKSLETLKKTDKIMYDVIYDRVCAESIAIRYNLINLYGDTYEKSVLQQMKEDFKIDADRIGFIARSEGDALTDTLYKEWGLV